ncbi:release factor [Boletus edulis BED1]|uniref:Release factor n=1 Tax=Boletus edulis BED1 TaxID=1328754 RepID=A0AAD4GAE9_BOLED|nr:release factor [Boletus edulis BED1]
MLSSLLRVHGPLRRSAQHVRVRSNHTQLVLSSANAIDQLENDGARILRAVRKRVETRKELLSKMSEGMSSPEDIARARHVKELEPLHDAWTSWSKTRKSLLDTLPLLKDPDPTMRSLAEDEFTTLKESLSTYLSATFPSLLVPPSQTRSFSALLELKAGVGGSEAMLFLTDLLRVYVRYAHSQGWRADVIQSTEVMGGGMRDAIVEVKGDGGYDTLRWETGVHRVQRVPATEASGRVHTSTVAIIVLPLNEEAEPAADDNLFKMEDVRVEVMRSRGAGGQHVNKTESAVRLTHMPTGVTVSMQDERSQHQNKRRAFQVLRARLMDMKITREIAERRATRQNLVRTADRSDKIRTYNYAQDRVTDHRIGLSLMNLQSFMEDDGVQEFLDAMRRNWQEEMMEAAVSDAD